MNQRIDKLIPLGATPPYERTVRVHVEGSEIRKVPVTGGSGFRTELGDKLSYDAVLEISIDIAAIVSQLGKKALGNKSGQSSDGHVHVKRIQPRS